MPERPASGGGMMDRILLALWALVIAWIGSRAEAYIRDLEARGLAPTKAEAMRLAAGWLEGMLAGPIGQAVVRTVAREAAKVAAEKIFPNDPDTPAWGGG